jgi:prepilin-type N-terminal cleavage/methylation domain-containing protein
MRSDGFKKNKARGFTLFELIVTLAIIGLLGLGIGTMFLKAVEGYVLARTANEKFQKISYAMDRLLRETKNMDELTQISSTAIQYQRDGVDFGIALVGSDLRMIRASAVPTGSRPGSVLLDDVTSFSFSFEDSSGNAWTIPADNSVTGLSKVIVRFTVRIVNNSTRQYALEVNPLYNNMVNGPV